MKCHACKKDKDDFEIVNDKRRLTCNECKNKRLLNKCELKVNVESVRIQREFVSIIHDEIFVEFV
jgi:DNA-directed RNA polymerase subunit RPC12/RpoP